MTDNATRYIPLLKGRMGEFRALGEIGYGFSDGVVPLIEIPLSAAESDSDDETGDTPAVQADTAKFAAQIQKHWPSERRLIVDTSLAPSTPDEPQPTVSVLETLASKDYDVTPTIRPSDDEEAIAAVGGAVRACKLDSACIRMSGDDLDDNQLPMSQAVSRAVELLALPAERIDLILDFGSVADDQAATFAARIARLVLSEVPFRDQWRTLVCAAGAFPPDLGGVQAEVLTSIPRFDAAVWEQVVSRVSGRPPIFGDYAIGYPTPSSGVPFAPAPQLRWTWQANWLVYKGRKRDRRGHAQFYDICRRMVSEGVVDPATSWGDLYVRGASNPAGPERGTGNAMTWRAIGTSHHIAHVANRLATLGAP